MKTMFLPVFSVKAVRVIKICNDKKPEPTVIRGFFYNLPKPTINPKMATVTALKHIQSFLWPLSETIWTKQYC